MSKNGTLTRAEIPEAIKLIPNTDCYYASELGYIYKKDQRGKYLKLKRHVNKRNGYLYVGIRYSGDSTNTSCRVHVLVAKTLISNPDGLLYVGHWDNNKQHDEISNLYWTTAKDNSQKAVDDGLSVNDKGIKDSQSFPIACYNNKGSIVAVYGSISEAGRLITGTTKSSIAKVVDKSSYGTKGFTYRRITKKFYNQHLNLAGLKLVTKPIAKKRREFNLFYNGKLVCKSNNQKQTGIQYGIPQAVISAFINGKRTTPCKGYTATLVSQEKL